MKKIIITLAIALIATSSFAENKPQINYEMFKKFEKEAKNVSPEQLEEILDSYLKNMSKVSKNVKKLTPEQKQMLKQARTLLKDYEGSNKQMNEISKKAIKVIDKSGALNK